ncbi:MAG: NAD-dependent epimerase/dehydratase family protein [Propionibacteriaceae bacterium]|nr:NAD-dependent epimerase/dehydratase family protein [Propionibacteriaceae bacterium]
MSAPPGVAVIGATGFVGSAVTRALEANGFPVQRIRAPRLPGMLPVSAVSYLESEPKELSDLSAALQGVDVVVNAAGDPDASSTDVAALTSANGVLPGLVAAACLKAGVERLVHVSSAAVQGRLPVLDDSDAVDAGSDYSQSKLLGENLVRKFSAGKSVIYRPSSVHGIDRGITRKVARIASGPLSTVARPGTAPSPQALISNVADAISFLATTALSPPAVVIHPWEGLTTSDVMLLLSGRSPRRVPQPVARAVVETLALAGRIVPRLTATTRRVEMLWFGQAQAESWLTTVGWLPPSGRAEWAALGRTIRAHMQATSTQGQKT